MEQDDPAMKSLVNLIPALGKEYVHIKCPNKVLTLLDKLSSGGINALQVIADFDHTVTKQHVGGERHVSSFCVINKCTTLPEHFKDKDRTLLEKYLPIERDPNLSKEEKIPHMVDWYTFTSELLHGFPLGPEEITSAVSKSDTHLRTGTAELVSALDEVDVPMLIFSAGLGDVVNAILKCHGVVNKNIHVISNFLKYKDGHVNGFTTDMVHPFNKNGKAAEHTKYFELMSSRHNVILMGDNLGDSEMADGVPNTDAVLKIGFLYGVESQVPKLLPKYMDHFDIVLVDDQTMDIAHSVFNLVKKN